MIAARKSIIENLCYTDLVYGRINKKLSAGLSNEQIESFIAKILNETDVKYYTRKGKNFYVSNAENNVRITINSNTFRVITVDRIQKMRIGE